MAPDTPCSSCARAQATLRCSECGKAACPSCLLVFEEQVDDFFLEVRLCRACRKRARAPAEAAAGDQTAPS